MPSVVTSSASSSSSGSAQSNRFSLAASVIVGAFLMVEEATVAVPVDDFLPTRGELLPLLV